MPRNIRLLYIHNFLSDFWPQWPFLIIYFADITHSYTTAMSILAVETVSAALFDIPTGIFSDRTGRRLTMAGGSLCWALALICYAAAHDANMLYIGAILWGLGQCLFSGTANALLYETLKENNLQDRYHHYRGSTGSMYQLALCLSAFLSMALSQYGLRTIFACAIIPQLLAIFVGLCFEEPRRHTATKPKGFHILKSACIKTWRNPHLFWLVVARSINYGAGEAKFKFHSAFVNMLWPIWAVGLYRGLNHMLGFIGFRCAANLIEKFGTHAVFLTRDTYWFITQGIATLFPTLASPLIILSGAFWFGPGEVASDHLMQKEFTDAERATMGSISSFGTSIVFAVTSLILGLVTDNFGIPAGFGLGICITALSLPVNLRLFRKHFAA